MSTRAMHFAVAEEDPLFRVGEALAQSQTDKTASATLDDDLALLSRAQGAPSAEVIRLAALLQLDRLDEARVACTAALARCEIDAPETQAWKQRRLVDLGLEVPPTLRFVPVDFERGESWVSTLVAAGFDATGPAVIASTGVSMYLTKEAVADTLREVAALASGSTLVMSFMLPIEMAEPAVRPGIEAAARGASANGTPWLSFFTPEQMLSMAQEAGFSSARHVSADALTARYFANRADGLRLPSNSEELLIAER